jgi:hypothetical protein
MVVGSREDDIVGEASIGTKGETRGKSNRKAVPMIDQNNVSPPNGTDGG